MPSAVAPAVILHASKASMPVELLATKSVAVVIAMFATCPCSGVVAAINRWPAVAAAPHIGEAIAAASAADMLAPEPAIIDITSALAETEPALAISVVPVALSTTGPTPSRRDSRLATSTPCIACKLASLVTIPSFDPAANSAVPEDVSSTDFVASKSA
jgi:hypothetical protein